LLLDNRIDSIFGRGWRLAGVQELVDPGGGGGSPVLLDSGGDREAFDPVTDPAALGCDPAPGTRVYASRLDGRTLLEHLPDGTWRRTLQDGTQYDFDPAAGGDENTGLVPGAPPILLTRVADRYGN